MEILYHTDEVLEMRPRPWRLFVLMGILFTLVGIVVYFFLGQKIILACTRETTSQPSCMLSRTFLGYTISEKSLNGLVGARLIESEDDDGDLIYKIILDTEQQQIPVTTYFSSGYQAKLQFVGEVNAFFNYTDKQTVTVETGGGNALIMPIVCACTGLLELFVGLRVRNNIWRIDKVEHMLTRKRKNLLGSKVTEYALDQITGAMVASSRDSEGDTTYRINFTTSSGEDIPMTSLYTSGFRKKQETVTLINEFLEA
jgi:hypothetical protein